MCNQTWVGLLMLRQNDTQTGQTSQSIISSCLDVSVHPCSLERVLFFAAKPRDEDAFDALRAEAVAERDLVVLPHVWEHYDNITHQTLEMCRAAALERRMTHLLKAR